MANGKPRKQTLSLVNIMDSSAPTATPSPINHDEDIFLSSTNSSNGSRAQELITRIQTFPKTLCSQIVPFVTIEPMLLLQMIALSSTAVNIQNYYIEAICHQTYGNDTSVDCANLPNYPDKEAEIERKAALYSTYRNLIETLLPIIYSLFLGPWSDKHGSKIPMILPLIGYAVSSSIYYSLSQVQNLNPPLLLLASIPVALSGGYIAFILSAFRYIASITNTENRSFRIAVAEGSWFLGSPIGLLGSAKLLKVAGYSWVFISCAVLYSLALLYVIIFIKSDKPESELNSPDSNMIRDMFNVEAVKETIGTCFRKRPGSKRMWIILLLFTICLRIITLFGSMNITLLYTRKKFNWDGPTYSVYTTIDGVLGLIGSGSMAIIGMKILKIPDKTIGVISAVSYLTGSIIWMMAAAGWMMYLGAAVQMFCGLITIVVRSMLSKIVSRDELGKVYSFLASGEATMPLIAAPLYNLVYVKTVDSFPGAVYLVSAGFNGLILCSFIYFLFAMPEEEGNHSELEEEDETGQNIDAHVYS